MKINLLRGYLLSATQHGNKPPSRHEAESLKRRAHHSPYTCTLTTLTFRDCSPPCRARLPTSQAATVCST
ncbi:hypothetical protein PSK37_29250, partial [Escherichia coli]|nr:hypothetical protein [Escherichia coli]